MSMEGMIHKQTRSWRPWIPALQLSAALCLTICADAEDLDFYREIHPFLQSNCVPCHNKKTTKAGLNLETRESALKGGESGAGLIPGNSKESLVYQSAAHMGDSPMPPKNNKSGAVDLNKAQLALLGQWIDQGAKASTKAASKLALGELPDTLKPVYSVTITPDGRYAACGRGGEIAIYDLTTRQFVANLSDKALKTGRAHGDLVHSLHFSPDGERLASGGFREVKIWRRVPVGGNVAKKTALPLGTLAVTPGGRRLVSADRRNGIQVFDAATGALEMTVAESPKTNYRAISISPDGSSAALVAESGEMSVWPLSQKGARIDYPAQPAASAVSWSADGRLLLAGGEDKTVRIWPAAGRQPQHEFKVPSGSITAVLQDPSSMQIVVSTDDGYLRFWSAAESKVIREIKTPSPLILSISSDAKLLAVGAADSTVRVFDFKSEKPLFELRADSSIDRRAAALEWQIARLALDQAHHTTVITRIDTAAKSLEIHVKKATDAIAAAKKELPEKQKAQNSAQQAREAAEKAVNDAEAAGTATQETKADASLQAKIKETTTKLAAAIMAANSATAAVTAAENHIKDGAEQLQRIEENKTKNANEKTEAQKGLEIAKQAQTEAQTALARLKQEALPKHGNPLAVAFSGTGRKLSAVFSDGLRQTWMTASGIPLDNLTGSNPLHSAALAPSADDEIRFWGSDGTLCSSYSSFNWILERTLGVPADKSPFIDRVSAVRFSPNSRILATGGGEVSRSGDILLWDTADWHLLRTFSDRHDDTVLSLDFSPDGKWLASGGSDKLAKVTDVETGKPVHVLEAHTHHVMGVAFRADGRILATSGGDGVVNTWDMQSGERVKKIVGWTKEVTSLQFMGASSKIVTSAAEKLVRIVSDDGTEVRAIPKLPDFMQSAASASSSPLIIAGGEDGALRVWDGQSGVELAVFQSP